MRKTIFKEVSGLCPTTQNSNIIEVEYRYIPILGSPSKQYKAVSYDCPYFDECSEGYCPIVKEHLTIEL